MEASTGTMDLFGDINDISSESDDDSQPPVLGQPVVVSTISTGPTAQSEGKIFRAPDFHVERAQGGRSSSLKHLMNG